MRTSNKMIRYVQKANQLPPFLRLPMMNYVMRKTVPFLKTSGITFEQLTQECVKVSVKNQKRVHNHIRGVHACVSALLAETASGFVFGLNTPDDKLMLLKSMKLDYTRRSKGNQYAVATLSDEEATSIEREEKGNICVHVEIFDDSGEEPVKAEMIWAWIPKEK